MKESEAKKKMCPKLFAGFIASGKGFVNIHAGSSTLQDWPEFQQIAGGTWGKDVTGHGPIHTFKVTIDDKNHPVMNRLITVNQRVKRLKRKTNWTDSELNELIIKEFYIKAELLSKSTGICHEVDHVIPLQGKYVSGLHHYTNLQILTKKQNRDKSNYY